MHEFLYRTSVVTAWYKGTEEIILKSGVIPEERVTRMDRCPGHIEPHLRFPQDSKYICPQNFTLQSVTRIRPQFTWLDDDDVSWYASKIIENRIHSVIAHIRHLCRVKLTWNRQEYRSVEPTVQLDQLTFFDNLHAAAGHLMSPAHYVDKIINKR